MKEFFVENRLGIAIIQQGMKDKLVARIGDKTQFVDAYIDGMFIKNKLIGAAMLPGYIGQENEGVLSMSHEPEKKPFISLGLSETGFQKRMAIDDELAFHGVKWK